MNICYSDGLRQQGLILALERTELRVAVRGADDSLQFNLVSDDWVAEDGRRVTFEFPLGLAESQAFLTAIQEVSVEGLSAPRACVSGGECLLKRMSGSLAGTN
jgi:hypothetical protein